MDGGSLYYERQGILIIQSTDNKMLGPSSIFIVPDDDGFSMIDAGCGGPNGPKYLLNGLDHWGLDTGSLHTVVLTHAHPDHMGAMSWLLEETRPRVLIHHKDAAAARDPRLLMDTYDIPLAIELAASAPDHSPTRGFDLLAFFDSAGCGMGRVEAVETLNEGDVVTMDPFAFEVIHTPGHSPGHIALFDKASGVLLAGDAVGHSPSWYTPTSGGVTGYLSGLDKLRGLEAGVILPSHGPVMDDPAQAIAQVRRKLVKRDDIIIEALGDGPKTFLGAEYDIVPATVFIFFSGMRQYDQPLDQARGGRDRPPRRGYRLFPGLTTPYLIC